MTSAVGQYPSKRDARPGFCVETIGTYSPEDFSGILPKVRAAGIWVSEEITPKRFSTLTVEESQFRGYFLELGLASVEADIDLDREFYLKCIVEEGWSPGGIEHLLAAIDFQMKSNEMRSIISLRETASIHGNTCVPRLMFEDLDLIVTLYRDKKFLPGMRVIVVRKV